jgi:hypothetical protein
LGRVIDGIEVERQVAGRAVKGSNELVEEHVAQAPEGLDGDGILEARQGGPAGQVVVLGGAAGASLKTGSLRRVSWSFWSS